MDIRPPFMANHEAPEALGPCVAWLHDPTVRAQQFRGYPPVPDDPGAQAWNLAGQPAPAEVPGARGFEADDQLDRETGKGPLTWPEAPHFT